MGRRAAAARLVFQEPTLLPWASALDNVRLPLRLTGDDGYAAARAALARVGLAGFEAARPRQLSGGMRMRVSLARALITAPRLLLLDEPFAALDEFTRHGLQDDLRQLWRADGSSVVVVTHSIYEAAYLARRIIVMSPRPGRIAAEIESTLGDEPDRRPTPPWWPTSPGRCRRSMRFDRAAPALFAVGFLALWEAAVHFFAVPSYIVPGPVAIPGAFLAAPGLLLSSLASTLFVAAAAATLPYFLAGLRVSGGLALVGAVVAGSGGVASGLAYRILEAGYRLQIPRMFAALVLLSAAGLCINTGLGALEAWVLRRHS